MDDGKHTELELKLREAIERDFNSVIVTPGPSILEWHSTAPCPWPSGAATGEPFIEFLGGWRGGDDDIAAGLALTTFRHYARGRSGVLYWRTYPEIDHGRFYMHLLISDKPPLAISEEMNYCSDH